LKKQLEAKDNVLKTNNETQNQLQTTVDVLPKAEEANYRNVQNVSEEQQQLLGNIDVQTSTEEAVNLTVEMMCAQPKKVNTYYLCAVRINKLNEIHPAINRSNLRPNTVVC
jgi:hypothetical protein